MFAHNRPGDLTQVGRKLKQIHQGGGGDTVLEQSLTFTIALFCLQDGSLGFQGNQVIGSLGGPLPLVHEQGSRLGYTSLL